MCIEITCLKCRNSIGIFYVSRRGTVTCHNCKCEWHVNQFIHLFEAIKFQWNKIRNFKNDKSIKHSKSESNAIDVKYATLMRKS